MLQMESDALSLASMAGRPTSFQKYLKQPRWISSRSDTSASEKLYRHAERLSADGSMGSCPQTFEGSIGEIESKSMAMQRRAIAARRRPLKGRLKTKSIRFRLRV